MTDKLCSLYSSSSIIRTIKSLRLRWSAHEELMKGSEYKVLVKRPEGKRPLG
jgi:hypothetical protein